MTRIYGFRPIRTKPHPRGSQILYRFSNGYGASVIPGHHDDERDVAIIHWSSTGREGWEFDWTTPVAEHEVRLDVPDGVEAFLTEVSELPPRRG